MFTGLIEEIGKVKAVVRGTGATVRVAAPKVAGGSGVGDSISVNGVCLTVTKISEDEICFDAVEETLARSTLGGLRPGDPVNLERAVSADRLFGGHFVLGHVDGTGTVQSFDRRPAEAVLSISAPEEVMRYVVPKGSIAVDGISLTVASCDESRFNVAVIPHTIENTNLPWKRPGEQVNLEADIIGKYVEKFVAARAGGAGVTAKLLAEAGWLEE
ncbi:MAG: riboflavin synthase [Armatimonadetes bacterium]|nr:riboflavin synthase [Armatimonadota bacterium]